MTFGMLLIYHVKTSCQTRISPFSTYGLKYGYNYRIIYHMKTTIDLDDTKLLRVMKLAGLKTRKEAIDYALNQAERIAKMNRLFEKPWTKEALKNAIDPQYNLLALREMEKPKSHNDSR